MSYQTLAGLVIQGNGAGAEEELKALLAAGQDSREILDVGLIPAMDVVGEKFTAGVYYVPEMLVAAMAMKRCLAVLQPLLSAKNHDPLGRVVIATVKGDLHDIGKNIVAMTLEGAGFDIVDLGVDVPPEAIVQATLDNQPQIVGLSCLLTTTMPMMKAVVGALEDAQLRETVKVLVGGAPTTPAFAETIGADAFARDAGSAARVAKQLVTAR